MLDIDCSSMAVVMLTASVAIPSGYSTGRCGQTGRTREDSSVLLLLAVGQQLLGQVFVFINVVQ